MKFKSLIFLIVICLIGCTPLRTPYEQERAKNKCLGSCVVKGIALNYCKSYCNFLEK